MPLAGLATLTAVSASLPRPVRQLSEGYVPPEQVVRPPLTPERYVVMLSFDVAEGREAVPHTPTHPYPAVPCLLYT